MAIAPFNHGVRVVDAGNEPRPLSLANVSKIGAAVTAPEADASVPMNEPWAFFTHDAASVAKLGTTGTAIQLVEAVRAQGIEAEIVISRVAEGESPEATRVNMMGSAAAMTGIHALSFARGHVGVEPDIVLAPGWTGGRIDNAKNPVADAVQQVATKLKAIAVIDTGTASAEDSLAYRADFSSRFVYLVDPYVRVAQAVGLGQSNQEGESIVSRPAAAFAAALFVKRDKQKGGPFWSPSNQEVLGILGTARPISYFDGEIDHEANRLNGAGIATFIPARLVQDATGRFASNGRILWGNRTASDDPLWAFVNVVRTRAHIEKAIANGFRPWANDQNMTAQHVLAVRRSLQSLLDELTTAGAILGGRAYWDRDANPNASLKSGILRIEFDAEETPPLEDLIFGSRRNEAYFDTLAAGIQRGFSTYSFADTITNFLSV